MESELSKSFSQAEGEKASYDPETPLIRISPDKRWHDLDWRRIWRQKDLLKSFVLRDIRLRYRQTLLGVLWAIIQPLAPLVIYTIVFNRFFSEYNKGVPYSVYVFCGLVPWLYFSNAITQSGNSLSHHSYLLGKIYFPRLMLPMSSVIAGGLDFIVGFALLMILAIAYGIGIGFSILIVPFLWLLTAILALSIGAIFASMSVVFRDVRNLLPFAVQMVFFLTPVIYPPEALPQKWQWIVNINPVTGIIENVRAALLGGDFAWAALAVTLIWTIILSFIAMIVFARVQKHTADYI